jgi:hypothetical protein
METLISLLKTMSTFFTSFSDIFFKNFIKERRYLHFFLSIAIVLASFIFAYHFMNFDGGPVWVYLVIGWFQGYTMNWVREWYYNYKSKYEIEFDYLDVYAGAYGGIIASILYLIIIYKQWLN